LHLRKILKIGEKGVGAIGKQALIRFVLVLRLFAEKQSFLIYVFTFLSLQKKKHLQISLQVLDF
jgi:hypothetical protein